MATKAAPYKAKPWLFGLSGRFREKLMAKRAKRAHGERMHHYGVDAELFAKDSRK
jgi:hypothetical protein